MMRVHIFLLFLLPFNLSFASSGDQLAKLRELYKNRDVQQNAFLSEAGQMIRSPEYSSYNASVQAEICFLYGKAVFTEDRKEAFQYYSKADSLHQNKDILKAMIAFEIARELLEYGNRYEEVLEYIEPWLTLENEVDLDVEKYRSFIQPEHPKYRFFLIKVIALRRAGRIEEAISIIEEIIPQLEEDSNIGWNFKNTLANLYSTQGRNAESIEIRKELFKEASRDNNLKGAYLQKLSIASTLSVDYEIESSLNYLKEHLEALENGIIEYQGSVFLSLVNVYIIRKEYQSAKFYLNLGTSEYRKSNNIRFLGYTYIIGAKLYSNLNRSDSVYMMCDSAEYYLKDMKDLRANMEIEFLRLTTRIKQNKHSDKDLNTIDSLLNYVIQNNLRRHHIELLRLKRDLFVKNGDLDSIAYFNTIIDSIDIDLKQDLSSSNNNVIKRLESELDNEKEKVSNLRNTYTNRIYLFALTTCLILIISILYLRNINIKKRAILKENDLKNKLILYYKSISHDIKFPLETLKEKIVSNDKNKDQLILDVNQTIDKLILLFQVDDVKLDKEEVNVQKLVNNVSQQLKLHEHIQFNVIKNKFLFADPFLLRQLLLNIFENCKRYIKYDDGLIQVEKRRELGFDVLFISDNGKLIPSAFEFEKMLKPFTSDKSNPKQKGMGMFIVKRIMDKHNGKIQFKRNIGKGMTIELFFPIN